jgi:hypothetical protein
LGAGHVVGELIDDAVAPFGLFDFPADVGPDLPVQFDELLVDDLDGCLFGGVN